jgi:hypothetical protein
MRWRLLFTDELLTSDWASTPTGGLFIDGVSFFCCD